MKLIFLHGLPGVGKLTVARELAKLTGFKVFHNHLTVDLVTSLYEFGSRPFVEARETIWLYLISQAITENVPGLIFTFAPEHTVPDSFIQDLRDVVEGQGNEIVFVELTCSEAELEKRLTDPSRKRFGKLNLYQQYLDLRESGAFVTKGIPPPNGLSLDITNLSPSEAAEWIAGKLAEALPKSDGSNASSVKDAYADWAKTYDEDRNLTRDLDKVVTRQLLGEMRCRSVIEIGCGTGKNTPLLAQIGEQVLALDFSEHMIRKARAKVRQLKLDNVSFAVSDITNPWPCADQSADLLVGNLVLEHVADLDGVFQEAARCVVARGRFFVCELHPARQYQGTKANFRRDHGKTEIDAFVHHISDFLAAAKVNGFAVKKFDEWWHEEDQGKPPRLVSFLLEKEA